MFIHKFVNKDKPNMVLIHGVLTPWQIWTPQINAFKAHYNIYAVALNAHTEHIASEFISVAEEAAEIIRYLKENNVEDIDVLCGISLGGKIAHEIWKSNKLTVRNLIMDGAPLTACPKFAINVMIYNYKSIIHKSQRRDSKVIENFKKHFLPEIYLKNYLKIADLFTDRSIENIVNSVFSGGKIYNYNNKSRILFIHGTRSNEILSKKSAKLLKKHHPSAQVVCFKNDPHCYKAIYQPEEWIKTVKDFLNGN